MCRALGVSRSGYYDWLGRGESDRERANRRLLTEIRAIFEANKMRYGSPRVWLELRAQGMVQTVAWLGFRINHSVFGVRHALIIHANQEIPAQRFGLFK